MRSNRSVRSCPDFPGSREFHDFPVTGSGPAGSEWKVVEINHKRLNVIEGLAFVLKLCVPRHEVRSFESAVAGCSTSVQCTIIPETQVQFDNDAFRLASPHSD